MTKIGDVFGIQTKIGLALFQVTHRHSQLGHLIRVLEGHFSVCPEDLEVLVTRPHRFLTFFPVTAAEKRGIIRKVGSLGVPESCKAFPVFRAAGATDRKGRVLTWWLWDGSRSWPAGDLSDEQRKLPIRAVWNDTLLIERIDAGWTPESDARGEKMG